MQAREASKTQFILRYLNSNKNQFAQRFLRFIYKFSKKKSLTLITVRRVSYLNQLHKDTFYAHELFEYLLFGDKKDPILTARLADTEEIQFFTLENQNTR